MLLTLHLDKFPHLSRLILNSLFDVHDIWVWYKYTLQEEPPPFVHLFCFLHFANMILSVSSGALRRTRQWKTHPSYRYDFIVFIVFCNSLLSLIKQIIWDLFVPCAGVILCIALSSYSLWAFSSCISLTEIQINGEGGQGRLTYIGIHKWDDKLSKF